MIDGYIELHRETMFALLANAFDFERFGRMYSELISSSIAEGGPYASKTSFVKLLR